MQAEAEDPYAFRISGFKERQMNAVYVARPELRVNGQKTYWKGDDWFMYYREPKPGEGRWTISPRIDVDSGEDLFRSAQQCGKKGLAFSTGLHHKRWMECFDGQWRELTLQILAMTQDMYENEEGFLGPARQSSAARLQALAAAAMEQAAAEQAAVEQARAQDTEAELQRRAQERQEAVARRRKQEAEAEARVQAVLADAEARRRAEADARDRATGADARTKVQAATAGQALPLQRPGDRPTVPPTNPLLGSSGVVAASSAPRKVPLRFAAQPVPPSSTPHAHGAKLSMPTDMWARASDAKAEAPDAHATERTPPTLPLVLATAGGVPSMSEDPSLHSPGQQKILSYADILAKSRKHPQVDPTELPRAGQNSSQSKDMILSEWSITASASKDCQSAEQHFQLRQEPLRNPSVVELKASYSPSQGNETDEPGQKSTKETCFLEGKVADQLSGGWRRDAQDWHLTMQEQVACREEHDWRKEAEQRRAADTAQKAEKEQQERRAAEAAQKVRQDKQEWRAAEPAQEAANKVHEWRAAELAKKTENEAQEWRAAAEIDTATAESQESKGWQGDTFWHTTGRSREVQASQPDVPKAWGWHQGWRDTTSALSTQDSHQPQSLHNGWRSQGVAHQPQAWHTGWWDLTSQTPLGGSWKDAPRQTWDDGSWAQSAHSAQSDWGLLKDANKNSSNSSDTNWWRASGTAELDKHESASDPSKKNKMHNKDNKDRRELLLEPRERKKMKMPTSLPADTCFPPTIDGFYMFMREREMIRIRRSRGIPWPWTDDPVLQCCRISNVRREHDRTGLLVQRLLSSQAASWNKASGEDERERLARSFIISIALWRRFGSADFISQLGFVQVPESDADFSKLEAQVLELAVAIWCQGLHACTDAYRPASHCWAVEFSAWMDAGDNEPISDKQRRQARIRTLQESEQKGEALRSLRPIREGLVSHAGESRLRRAYAAYLNSESSPMRVIWEQCGAVASAICHGRSAQTWRQPAEALMAVPGYSQGHGVYAAEIIRDLLSTPLLGRCTDLESWVPIDNATRHCLNRIHCRDPGDEPPREQLQREIREVFGRRRQLWPGSIAGEPSEELQLYDVRSQLAEFERYTKARAGKPERAAFHPRFSV